MTEISVGFEINHEFIPFIKENLGSSSKDLNGTTYEFLKQKNLDIDFEKKFKSSLIFQDPHTLDKKIDVKKLQFGSKIDKDSSKQREEMFYTVKEVISPEKQNRLNNDLNNTYWNKRRPNY